MSRIRFPKSLFIFSSSFSSSSSSSSSSVRPRLLQISHFSNSSGYPSYARRHDDDSRNVPVSVWWDFENCNLPADVNVFRIVHCITEAVRAKGIKGPLQITAFGDVFQLTRAKQEALTSTGINLTHIPNGGKNSADRSLLVDLMYWVSQNPPPAHLFLISGDRDFAGILHRLRMNNYNILLACPERPPNVLCSAATIMWHWNSLLKGENLPGKHFNHPPDGPFGSWYGHHKVPLDNPFSDGEQSTGSQIEEISDPASDFKLRPIPKATLRQIRHILYSYPEGISVSDLRAELAKADIHLEKDYYGYRKFSRFLLSMAHVRCQVRGDGQLFVHCVTQKSPEPSDRSLVPSTSVDNEELNLLATCKLSGEGENMVKDEAQMPPMASSHELGMEDVPEKPQQAVDVAKAQVTENQLPPKENKILSSGDVSQSVPERHKASESYNAEQSYAAVEKNGITNDSLVKLKPEDKYVKSTRKEADAGCHAPYSSPLAESVIGKQIGGNTETYSNKLDKRPTFFGWIKSQWPFRRSDGNSDDLIAHQNKMAQNTGEPKLSKPNLTVNSEEPMLRDMKQTVSHSEEPELSNLKQTVSPTEEPELSEMKQTVNRTGKPELFSSNSFWSDMESFVFTRKGSILVSRSRSRKDMMQNFQRFGPMVLSSLSEDDLLQLVDLLISEKKWLEERPSQTFPFRLTPPVGKSSVGLSHGANGLRSLFLSSTTESNLQKSSEGDLDKKYQSTLHTGVSPPAAEIKHTDRSRTDVLADIQKLVSEILREHSEGYNMGGIPRLFLERYGYPLDLQKLGYHKLVHLLQTLPRVKIESTYLFPTDTNSSDAVVYSDSELSDSNPKDDRKDSPWEELGPVSVGNSNLRDPESKVRQKAVELETSIHPDYESSLSDDDYSESEEDSSSLTRAEGEGQPKHGVEDSSLLQTLESWYSNQGEDSAKSNNAQTTCNGMTDGLNPSRHSTSGTHSKIHAGEFKEKRKPLKSYSFVADSVSQKKDELIDGILQSLKKSDDLKMQN